MHYAQLMGLLILCLTAIAEAASAADQQPDPRIKELQILDQFGHTIEVLFSGNLQRGANYSVAWSGAHANTGIYYYKLVTSHKSYCGKIFRK